MKRTIIVLTLVFGFTSVAFAQSIEQSVGRIVVTVGSAVASSLIVSGVDGVSCGATAAINTAIRKNNYGGYQHDSDYQQCLNMQQSQRMQAYYMRMAMEQQAAAIAAQNAPRVTTSANRTEQYKDPNTGAVINRQDTYQETRGGRPDWVR